ncbi:MAG: hypothetical protein IT442_12555 [Phycisphaeraceae bacterium]|nr:hypothetical protein [Phycisphaeraceae bacterium]
MHARLLIVVGLSLLSCGDVLAGPITPNEVKPPRGVRPAAEPMAPRAVTSNLTDLSWQGSGDVHLASAGDLECLSPGSEMPQTNDPSPYPAMADGQAGIQTWEPNHHLEPMSPLPMVSDTAPAVEVSRSAEVTDLTH